MKKSLAVACSIILAAAVAGAFDIPGAGGGGKVDTKKFDELIASMDEVSATVDEAENKIDECDQTLAAIAEAHGIADVLADPAKITELKDAITDDDKAKLQAQVDVIKTVPGDLSAVAEKAAEIMVKIPDVLTDLASQITANPMAAKDLKDKQAQLQEGQTALEELTANVPALMDSSTNLTATVMGLL
jgi:prefoldin subunit 5